MTYYISQPLISQLGLDPCQFLSSVTRSSRLSSCHDNKAILKTLPPRQHFPVALFVSFRVLSSVLVSHFRYPKGGETAADFIRRSRRI